MQPEEKDKGSRTQERPGEVQTAKPEREPSTQLEEKRTPYLKEPDSEKSTELPSEATRASGRERKTKSIAVSQVV